MKRKINFLITIGSYWPEKKREEWFVLPKGGHFANAELEFETDNVNPMDDAFDALARELDALDVTSYHIWYWTWLD